MNSILSYTYILECSNGQYYVGSTTDLERRLQEHQAGLGSNFTKKHLPVKLVYYEEYQSVEEAFCREKQLHGWSRAKKEALIKGEFDKLPGLSASTVPEFASRSLSLSKGRKWVDGPPACRKGAEEFV